MLMRLCVGNCISAMGNIFAVHDSMYEVSVVNICKPIPKYTVECHHVQCHGFKAVCEMRAKQSR